MSGATSPRRLPIWAWIAIGLAGVIAIILLVLLVWPSPVDPPIPESDWGAGAVNIEPSWTGLLREWPRVDQPAFNPRLADLGYELFFDPVMSGNDKTSCASCHQPDYGFSGATPLAPRPDGSDGRRHAPSLWNVAYNKSFFWDGRAKSLEEQIATVIAAPDEMNQNPDELVKEISAIPVYKGQFDALFPDGVSEKNIVSAIAAFERTLVSDDSAFDQYARGDFDALTAQQRRGLALFRSAGMRCFECHAAPTFTNGGLAVTGVPDKNNDKGAGAVGGQDFAFKVPGLRNVVLHAAFMHNGGMATLDEVITFYAGGAKGFTGGNLDQHIGGFDISDQGRADLIAFLYALTDETLPGQYRTVNYVDQDGRVLIPASVPSGLEVIKAVDNPARKTLATLSAAPVDRPDCQAFRGGTTLAVKAGQSIQAAVDCAKAGDTIEVEPGVYHEQVVIDQSGITLKGKAEEPSACPLTGPDDKFPGGDAAPKWPILDGDVNGDGKPDLTDAVIASGNDFSIAFFMVRNYTGNGVTAEGVNHVTMRHIYAENTGLYGVYPVHSTGVLVECNVVTQVRDAGVYVGQSRDIVIRDNLAYDNVAGMEIENSVNAEAYGNESWGNVVGMTVHALPNLTSRVSTGHKVHDNFFHDNNRAKSDAQPGSMVTLIPIGTGLYIMATDDSAFYNNRFENNKSLGIALISAYQAFSAQQIGVGIGPLPERDQFYGNTFTHNGYDPDAILTRAGLPGADLLWDATGTGNTFDEQTRDTFPPILPGRRLPGFLQRMIGSLWTILAKAL